MRGAMLQISQKAASHKGSIWIKLLFDLLHHFKIALWLPPYADAPFEFDGTALHNHIAACGLCRCAQFSNGLHEAGYGIARAQLDIEDAVTCMCNGCRFDIMIAAYLFNLLQISCYL